MDGFKFSSILRKYKECPNCGASYKTPDLQCSLKNEVITISCKCGWEKKVDENNKEVNCNKQDVEKNLKKKID